MKAWQPILHFPIRNIPLGAVLRAGLVLCVCGMLATSCRSTAQLAPKPLTGDYPAMVVEVMAASAKHSEKRTPAEPAAAAVAAWRTGSGGSAAAGGAAAGAGAVSAAAN